MNIDSVLKKFNIDELSAMQQDVAHAMLHSDRDVLVLSPTGSGKTLAYLLPLVQMVDASLPEVQAVVVVPGRELALQSSTVLRDMGCGLRAMSLYGGRPTMDEHRQLRQVQPQVVFATPGRMNDHLDKGNITADHVRLLVLDEFDKCLAMGFRAEMTALLGKLPNVRRRVLLSATEAEDIPRFVQMGRTERVDYLADDEQVPERVNLFRVKSPAKDKLETLALLLANLGDQSSIVFLNFRESVERTDEFLRARGFVTSAFHGGLDQRQREDALYKFSNASANVLVSTDLASRGLDIPDVDNIIHYHLPENEDAYVHRVGRTARWDKQGRAFFILGPGESIPAYVASPAAPQRGEGGAAVAPIQEFLPERGMRVMPPRMATLYIGKGRKDKISKGDIVGFLCKIGRLESADIGRIDVKDRYTYVAVSRGKVEQALRLTRGEKIKGIKTLCELVK